MEKNIQFLKQVEIISLLDETEIREIIPCLKPIEIERGKTLFHEGDPGSELYIVESGKLSIGIRLPDGKEREIANFLTGEFFGEMSIFENAPRSATCHTKENSRLLALNQDDFFELMETSPGIAVKMMYKMLNVTTQRLRNTSGFLSDMVHWGEEARRRAITDDLTGAFNRRFLDEAFPEYFQISINTGQPLSVVMVDLDRFREINELYSMETGNLVIQAAASVFKKHMREKDILVRYGGDEFTFLLPATDSATAFAIGEKIRLDVAALDLLKKFKGAITSVTTSQGIACYPEHASDLKGLRAMADKALYRAKEEGRNKVVRAD